MSARTPEPDGSGRAAARARSATGVAEKPRAAGQGASSNGAGSVDVTDEVDEVEETIDAEVEQTEETVEEEGKEAPPRPARGRVAPAIAEFWRVLKSTGDMSARERL